MDNRVRNEGQKRKIMPVSDGKGGERRRGREGQSIITKPFSAMGPSGPYLVSSIGLTLPRFGWEIHHGGQAIC